MPKKKTGARKKAEKQKQRQKEIKAAAETKSLVLSPCNLLMVRPSASKTCSFILDIILCMLQECDKCKRYIYPAVVCCVVCAYCVCSCCGYCYPDDRRTELSAISASRCRSCQSVHIVVSVWNTHHLP